MGRRVANVQLLNVTNGGLINFLKSIDRTFEKRVHARLCDRGSVLTFVLPLYAGLRVGEKSITGCECTGDTDLNWLIVP